MKSLKNKNRYAKSYRDAQLFMLDCLNLMSMAYAVELHDNHGFGAKRLTSLSENAIKLVHDTIAKFEGDFTDTALKVRCRYFNFDPKVALDDKGAVRFAGGILPRK